jgi:hypothetical protein
LVQYSTSHTSWKFILLRSAGAFFLRSSIISSGKRERGLAGGLWGVMARAAQAAQVAAR